MNAFGQLSTHWQTNVDKTRRDRSGRGNDRVDLCGAIKELDQIALLHFARQSQAQLGSIVCGHKTATANTTGGVKQRGVTRRQQRNTAWRTGGDRTHIDGKGR